MNVAPIALFVYNRPWHTRKTIEALQKNELADLSELFIYSDTAKNEQAETAVAEVREYVRSIDGFKNITIIERENNLGLAGSIIDGVTTVVNKYGKVIVLEDDLITSPYFLTYMNESLNRYRDEDKVMQISGYMFQLELSLDEEALLLPFTTSWGWATWQRAWIMFDPEAKAYSMLKKSQKLQCEFNLMGAYPYFDMLEAQLNGKINSWAIRWYLSVFMQNGLTLYPQKALINNIGFDGSGVHCDSSEITQMSLCRSRIQIFPTIIEVQQDCKYAVYDYLRKQKDVSIIRRIKKLLAILYRPIKNF